MDEFKMDNVIATFDRGFLSGKNCKDVLDRNRKFVMPGKTDYKVFKTILSKFKDAEKQDLGFKDHIYSVSEYEIGLRSAEGRTSADGSVVYDFTLPLDEDHGRDGLLKAFVCYDIESYNLQIQTHKLMIADIIEKASKIESKDPLKEFESMVGKASKYFDASADGKKVILKVKKNAESFFSNRAGMFILVTTKDVGWSEAMSAYEVRRLTEQAFNHSKGEDKRFRTSNKDRFMGCMLIRFISSILVSEIAARVREAKMENKFDVGDCIDIMNTISVRGYKDTKMLTEITDDIKDVCEKLGIRVPTVVNEGLEICDFDNLP